MIVLKDGDTMNKEFSEPHLHTIINTCVNGYKNDYLNNMAW